MDTSKRVAKSKPDVNNAQRDGVAPGAYGLAFTGAPLPLERFVPAPPDWSPWNVTVLEDERLPAERWSDDDAVFHLDNGAAVVDRLRSATTLLVPTAPPAEAFAHPLLGFTALAHAVWVGWPAFHAGSFIVDGAAWLVAGSAGSGKSSILGWCARNGLEVVADDLAIVADGQVLAGPRCIDLREDAAQWFGAGTDVGVLGRRRRWRVGLPTVAAATPVAGVVRPSWGSSVHVEMLPLAARLPTLVDMRAILRGDPGPHDIMNLIARPAVAFERPRDFAATDAAMRTLVDRLASLSDSRGR